MNFNINFSPGFSIGADQNDSVCQGLPVNLNNYYNTFGLTSNWYYNNSLFTNPNAATNPGTYTLIASNSIGCKDTAHVNLSTYFGSSLGSDIVKNICSGTTTDLTTLINTSGTSTTTWYLGNAPIPNPIFVSNNGLYSLIATYPNGCLDTAKINLNSIQNNVLGADQTVNICSYDAVNLNNNFTAQNNTIDWYINSQIVSNPSSISTAGYYTIIATDTNGCQDSSHKEVIINNTPNLGIDQTISGCYTGPLNLTQLFNTTGYNNTWYSAGSIISTPINVTSNGIYTIISTINTCSDTAIVSVNNNPKPSLGLDQSINICNHTSTNLNNLFSTGANSTVWYYNNSLQSSVTAVSDTGLYTIIETNSFGCSDTANINLQLLPTPSLGNDKTISGCYTGGVDLTQQYNTVGFTTNWYSGTLTISNPNNISNNGTYTLIATNNFGCRDTANIAVNINQNPLLGNDQSVSYCEGTTLDLNTLFNISTNTSTWYFGGSLISSSASQAGLYSLIATSNAGCTDTANVTVSLFSKPTLGNDLNINVCSNLTEDLTSYFNTTSYNTSWVYNSNSIAIPTNVNSTGNYTLYVVDNNGCMDTASVSINQLSSPQLGIDLSETICSDSSIDLNSLINITNLSGNWTYNGNTVANANNVNSQGTYNLIATNTNGCKDTVNVSLAVKEIPNPGPSQTLSMCQGQSLNLNSYYIIGNETILWSNNGQVITDATAIENSGTYELQLTNSNGCIAYSNANVTVLPKPEIGPSQTLAICSGSSIDLTNQFNFTSLTSSWEYNSNSIADPINADQPGNYQVISTNTNGCSDTAQVNLTVNDIPDMGPDLSYSLCQWQSLDLSALVNLVGVTTQYYFNGNTISNSNAVSDSGNYQIIATNASGCVDTLNIGYEQIECICAADFRTNSNCVEDVIQFQVIADSTIMNSHWQFTNSPINESYETNPSIKFSTSNDIKITLAIELSCGTDTITKTISLENCAEKCKTYIPQAFSPNNDGHNDQYQIIFNCQPEEYSFKIINRFGQEFFSSNDYTEQWDGNYNGTLPENGIYTYKLEYKLPYQDKEIKIGTFLIVQ
jgi:gliding motility-associated-like protein